MIMKYKALAHYSRLLFGAVTLSCAAAFTFFGERVVSCQQRLFATDTGRSCQTPADIYFQQHQYIPPPKTIHAVLHQQDQQDSVTSEGRGILVVGDVHGCLEELKLLHQAAVEANQNQPFEYVILVGDLVNKGPSSAQVVQFVQQQDRWLSVRGNHDNWALTAAMADDEKRRNKPKSVWINDLTDQDIQWLADLPYTIRIPASYWTTSEDQLDTDTLIVHAGLVPGVELKDQTFETMVTIRQINPCSSGEQPLWSTLWKGPEHVIFGHDAKAGLQQNEFATGLDTGCCYGKRITGMLLPQRQLVSVEARDVYSPIVENKYTKKE